MILVLIALMAFAIAALAFALVALVAAGLGFLFLVAGIGWLLAFAREGVLAVARWSEGSSRTPG